ncbi:MAG: hypothetical protein IT328_03285 [Caldilineaceae bacterium]|nr:hypothetical protein [Caldilineaceae bacterium]
MRAATSAGQCNEPVVRMTIDCTGLIVDHVEDLANILTILAK